MPDAFHSEPDHPPASEEVIALQALEVDLRVAVMACLSGQESRRWTVGELVERLKGLGISATKAGVTAALAEVELELPHFAVGGQALRGHPAPASPVARS